MVPPSPQAGAYPLSACGWTLYESIIIKGDKRIPALAKISIVFGIILVLNRLRLNLGLSLIIGVLILGLWMGLGFQDMGGSVFHSVTEMETVSLGLIVGLIMVLSGLMEQSGQMARLVRRFSILSRDGRTVGSVMAALIGLLPMPGGALFSAPMVEASLGDNCIVGEQKTALNYWFRHIWEYWWPLYPGVILAVALLEVKTWHFMAMMAVMTPVSILAGILFILMPIGKIGGNEQGGFSWTGVRAFIWEMMPILVVILFIFVFSILAGILEILGLDIEIGSGLSVLPGLIISIIWVCKVNRIPMRQWLSVIVGKGTWSMVFLVFAVMIFKGLMEDSQAVGQIRNELMAYEIPVILVILIMPFLSGLVTGIAVGFVGASFPVIIPMFQSPDLIDYLSMAGLAYSFGYVGIILSPVHLCLLVSKDYYRAGLLNSYQHIIKPVLMVMAMAVMLFFLVRLH
jgi:integral membrane protein (TIGR00529 family)